MKYAILTDKLDKICPTDPHDKLIEYPEEYFDRDKEPLGYKCHCGNEHFKVFCRGSYNTSIRCPECGSTATVHDG
jgi:hypothetical protein